MTKEELKQEAEESAKKFFGKPTDLVDLDNLRIFKNGYIAGAEPREMRIAHLEKSLVDVSEKSVKRIKELESTNKKISDECHKLVDTLERKQKGIAVLEKSCDETQELLDKQIEATYKLDKENAELKVDNAFYEKACEGATMMYEHLTKAKEIIKDYMTIVKGGNITVCSVPEESRCINVLKLNEEAEQFLNSEIKK